MGAAALACKTGGVVDPPKRRGEQQALPVPTVTMLPLNVKAPFERHLQDVKKLYDQDLAEGFGRVYLPYALERKYPKANREWAWQYVFPAVSHSLDPPTGIQRRHHVSQLVLQRAVKAAIRKAKIAKAASSPTFRHTWTSCDPSWRRPGGAHGEESSPASAAPPERGRLPQSQARGHHRPAAPRWEVLPAGLTCLLGQQVLIES